MGKSYLCFLFCFAALLACEPEKKKQEPVQQQESVPKKMIAEQRSPAITLNDLQDRFNDYLSVSNALERDIKTFAQNQPTGTSEQVEEILMNIEESLISASYQKQTAQAIKDYFDTYNGRVTYGNLSEHLAYLNTGGWPLGHECGSLNGLFVVEVDVDVELLGNVINVRQAHLIINAVVTSNGVVLNTNQLKQYLKKLCPESRITVNGVEI